MTDDDRSATTTTRLRPWGVLLGVLIFVDIACGFESTMVGIALPKLIATFSLTTNAASWTATVYLLVAAVSASLGGRLGDLYGRRRVLVIVLLIAAVGSLVSFLSPVYGGLLIGRALQGLNGAVIPLTIAIARDIVPGRRISVAVAVLSTTLMIAGSTGGIVAGVLIDVGVWRSVFIVSAAFLGVALLLSLLLPRSAREEGAKVDVVGGLLFVLGVSAILIGISFAQTWGIASPTIWALIVVGIAVLAVFVRYELRHPSPMVDLRVFARPVVAVTIICAALTFTSLGAWALLFSLIALSPTTLPVGLGLPAVSIGAISLAYSVVTFGTSPVTGRIIDRIGVRPVLIASLAVTALGYFALVFVDHSPIAFMTTTFVMGLAGGQFYASAPVALVQASPPELTGQAIGLFQTVQNMVFALGATLLGIVLSSSIQPGTTSGTLGAYRTAEIVMAVLPAIAVVFVIALRRGGPAGRPVPAEADTTGATALIP